MLNENRFLDTFRGHNIRPTLAITRARSRKRVSCALYELYRDANQSYDVKLVV